MILFTGLPFALLGEPTFTLEVRVKKIINDPAAVVAEALRGMALAHPDLLRVQQDPAVIVRADAPVRGKVAVISGGGSGHEPLLVELYLAHGIAEQLVADRGIVVERRLVGSYVTSLEMRGMSLTLLKLDDELTELWDAPVNTVALRWGI
jgi:dihydroxyacetone kinase